MEIIKYPKIRAMTHLKQEELLNVFDAYEKYDGANGRVYIDNNGELTFGSRNCIFANTEDENKRFKPAFDAIRKVNLPELLGNNLIVFFEIMIKHTLNYDWNITPELVILDVYDNEKQMFINIETIRDKFVNVGLHVARKLENVEENSWHMSEFGNFEVEGYVYKNYEKQIFYKNVRTEFKELNKEIFGKNKKEMNDDEKVAELLAPKARIDKIIYSISYEKNNPIDLTLMKYVPREVMNDIYNEVSIDELLKHNLTFNTKNVKCLIVKNIKRRILLLQNFS